MAILQTRRHFDRRNAAPVLAGLIVLGCIAVTLVVNALPTASGPAPQLIVLGLPQEVPRDSGKAATGVAMSAVPSAARATAPPRDFDYFPHHYVNQATKVEDPSPTF